MQHEKKMDETIAMEILNDYGIPEAEENIPAAAESSPEQVEHIPGMEAMLKQAELQIQEHRDAWLRARADADNVRRRAQIDVANAHKYAIENFTTDLLAVKDSIEAALTVENASAEALKSGVELTLRQFLSVFEKYRIEELNPMGQKFDPHLHQAISAIESTEPANTVIQVLQKGYRLNERVIRPALVIVAKSAS